MSERLIYSPFLRLVLFNRWFRVAFLGFVLLIVFLGLFLPRIWRVSPAGFLPVIKISGLDMAQAWSLKRSALKAMAAGDFSRANFAWGAAVGNNPANPDLLRGALRNTLRMEQIAPKQIGPIIGQTAWLLRLTGTNRNDAQLVATVYNRLDFHDQVLHLLWPVRERLNPDETTLWLKALFDAGRMDLFASGWKKLNEQQKANPSLHLYHAAYLAGWDVSPTAVDGRRELDTALDDPEHRTLANRLRLMVAAHFHDTDGYRDSLRRLERWQADTLLEHTAYWQLLAATGRKDEAVKLARSFPRPPQTAAEAARLAEAQISLGLREETGSLLQRSVESFGSFPELWVLRANLMLEEKRWEDLRALALEIRRHTVGRDALAGYSYYLEGRAELGLNRNSFADAAFEQMALSPFDRRAPGFAVARELLKLGYARHAEDILLPLEEGWHDNPDYWQTRFSAACELKEPDAVLTAAKRAFKLQPGSVVCMNNYAAALLVNRVHPDEAIKLTLQLLSAFPNSPAPQINHALALLMNERANDAEGVLNRIDASRLTSDEANAFYLARFEASLDRRDYDKAWLASDRIAVKKLFPNQVKWLEEARRKLPPRTVAK